MAASLQQLVAMSNTAVHKNSEAAQLPLIICISGYSQPIALQYFNCISIDFRANDYEAEASGTSHPTNDNNIT